MALRMGELDARAQERLRAALGEMLAEHFAYPGFYGYSAERLRVRPLDRIKRQEIVAYIETVGFAPLEPMAIDSAELRHYFEGVFLRYLDVNPHLSKPHMAGHRAQLRVEARRAAEELQRGLAAFVEGRHAAFGAPRPPSSWAARSAGVAPQPQWAPSPPQTPAGPVPAPQAASHQAVRLPASRVGPRPAPMPPAPAVPPMSDGQGAFVAPPAIDDRQIFSQLKAQLESYIRLAVRSYGLPERGGDPARALDDLRSSGLVDDTNLSLAERIFALTDSVRERGNASLDDYRQALTLYLLYHRSHLKS